MLLTMRGQLLANLGRHFLLILAFLCLASPVLAQEPKLIALPQHATSPFLGYRSGKFREMGKEANIGGWLVLNGARFRNSEFPELAKIHSQGYARQGFVATDPELTQLPLEPYDSKPDGQVVRGFAICPSRAICGDLIGSRMPFNLDTSL